MNTTLFVTHATNAAVNLFNGLRARVWARIGWQAHYQVTDLIQALKDERGEVRYVAAWMLSKIGCEAKIAVPALIEALKDEQGEVRCLAAKTLWHMGGEVEIPTCVLIGGLGDNERYVRRFAIRTLEKNQISVDLDSMLASISR
jgi:HEAT repeat protein